MYESKRLNKLQKICTIMGVYPIGIAITALIIGQIGVYVDTIFFGIPWGYNIISENPLVYIIITIGACCLILPLFIIFKQFTIDEKNEEYDILRKIFGDIKTFFVSIAISVLLFGFCGLYMYSIFYANPYICNILKENYMIWITISAVLYFCIVQPLCKTVVQCSTT